MNNYKRVMYQKDLIESLSKKVNVDFYGSRFEGFDEHKSLVKAIDFDKQAYDCVVVSRAWLNHGEGKEIDPFPSLR